jgi:hypothetical protein
MKLNLIAGNVLFVDGTKIRANAGRGKSHGREWYDNKLKEIDQRIEQLLAESEKIDQREADQGSSVKIDKELAQAERLKEKITEALKALQESGRDKVNLTDPQCAIMHSAQGSHASYNVQSVVDDQRGLIVQVEAVNDSTDVNQFARQIDAAQEQLGKPCEVGCADAGYADSEELKKIDEQRIQVVVPSQRQALHSQEEKLFSKSHFSYDQDKDCYLCPAGQVLKYVGKNHHNGKKDYRITEPGICQSCANWGKCTTAKLGRKIVRLAWEEDKQRFEAQYEANQEIYNRRKSRAEHPFGHIKRNLTTNSFMLRGQQGVQAESSILATFYNLARMMTLVGITALINWLKGSAAPALA